MNTPSPIPEDFLERVSAWHDGDLDAEAARFVAPRVLGDPALRARVARWHAIGDALRGQAQQPVAAGLPDRVADAIGALEPPLVAPGVAPQVAPRVAPRAAARRPVAAWLASAAALACAAVLVWPAGEGAVPASGSGDAAALTASAQAPREPAPAVRVREALPPLMAVAPASPSSARRVADVPPLVRAPQPTPEQLAPLPAVDAPTRPWPRGAAASEAFTVDYVVAPLPSPSR